jgi:hypothetical protein
MGNLEIQAMAEIDEQETTRATNDAYTGMLAISLLALVVGCALLYFDWAQYPSSAPPKLSAPAPQITAPPDPGQQEQKKVQAPPMQPMMPPMQEMK